MVTLPTAAQWPQSKVPLCITAGDSVQGCIYGCGKPNSTTAWLDGWCCRHLPGYDRAGHGVWIAENIAMIMTMSPENEYEAEVAGACFDVEEYHTSEICEDTHIAEVDEQSTYFVHGSEESNTGAVEDTGDNRSSGEGQVEPSTGLCSLTFNWQYDVDADSSDNGSTSSEALGDYDGEFDAQVDEPAVSHQQDAAQGVDIAQDEEEQHDTAPGSHLARLRSLNQQFDRLFFRTGMDVDERITGDYMYALKSPPTSPKTRIPFDTRNEPRSGPFSLFKTSLTNSQFQESMLDSRSL